MVQRTFAYRVKRWPLLLCLPVAAMFVYFFARKVLGPAEPVVLGNFLRLQGAWATAFYALCLLFCIGLLALLFVGLAASFSSGRSIELRQDRVRVPKSAFSSRIIEVPYRSIRALEVQTATGLRILHITHSGGKVPISAGALPNKKDFDYLVQVLAEQSRVVPQTVRVA